jgi:hypothetical protein
VIAANKEWIATVCQLPQEELAFKKASLKEGALKG